MEIVAFYLKTSGREFVKGIHGESIVAFDFAFSFSR